jgi:hypothetical protein
VPRLFWDSPLMRSGCRDMRACGMKKKKAATHGHVGLAPDVGFCKRLFELTRDAEIT